MSTQTLNEATAQPFRFLDLPPELRLAVVNMPYTVVLFDVLTALIVLVPSTNGRQQEAR